MLRLSDCLKQESRLALRLPTFQHTFFLSRFDALMFAVGGAHDLTLITAAQLDGANDPWSVSGTLALLLEGHLALLVSSSMPVTFPAPKGRYSYLHSALSIGFGSNVYTSRVVGMHRARCRRKQKGNEQKPNGQRVSPLPVMIVGAH